MTDRRSFVGSAALMLGGLLVWAVYFLFVYVFNALACARGFAGAELLGIGLVPFTIGAATLAALLIVAALGLVAARRARAAQADDVARFLRYTAALVALLSFVAVAWTGLSLLLIAPCA